GRGGLQTPSERSGRRCSRGAGGRSAAEAGTDALGEALAWGWAAGRVDSHAAMARASSSVRCWTAAAMTPRGSLRRRPDFQRSICSSVLAARRAATHGLTAPTTRATVPLSVAALNYL